jgi:hypothetical protein
MRSSLLVLILLICSLTYGQYYKTGGSYFKRNGTYLKPGPVSPTPDPSDFVGTIYKQVDYTALNTGNIELSDANATTLFGGAIDRESGGAIHDDSTFIDSLVIVTNDNGVQDTCWKVTIVDEGETNTSYGVVWRGAFHLNGNNRNDDTLTMANISYYIKVNSTWDWFPESSGGKFPGLGGLDDDGTVGPSGGIEGCGCGGPRREYCSGDGFTIRGNFDGLDGYEQIGTYNYIWQMNKPCPGPQFAYVWTPYRVHTDMMEIQNDTWYKVTIRIGLDDPGDTNGFIELAINDTIIMSQTGLNIASTADIKIDEWELSVFAGGGVGDQFERQWVWVDDVTLWTDSNRTALGRNTVMTNVPPMATPNSNF